MSTSTNATSSALPHCRFLGIPYSVTAWAGAAGQRRELLLEFQRLDRLSITAWTLTTTSLVTFCSIGGTTRMPDKGMLPAIVTLRWNKTSLAPLNLNVSPIGFSQHLIISHTAYIDCLNTIMSNTDLTRGVYSRAPTTAANLD